MTLALGDGSPVVTAFEQTLDVSAFAPSAKRIFGKHYDIFQNMHADHEVYQAARKQQLQEYMKQHWLDIHYYQDYGWPTVKLE